jgi:hypothetical protein
VTLDYLKFDGDQQYFVLDGQHRLTGLRYLFGQDPELSVKAKMPIKPPPGLANDELSVLVISDEDPYSKNKRLR